MSCRSTIAPGLAEKLWQLLPVAIVMLVYVPALFNGFVWDDWVALVELPFLNNREQEWLILAGNKLFSANYFRPITTLSHLIELRLFDPYPVYFHLTNIAFHVANTLLLALIARRFRNVPRGRLDLASLAVPLLYGLHPALVEPVAWISGRVDLLVTFFLLIALWLDMAIRRTLLRAIAVSLAFLFALLSKEMAATFPVLLVVWHLSRSRNQLLPVSSWWLIARGNGNLVVYAAMFVGFAAYLAARYQTLGGFWVDEGPAPHAMENLAERIYLVGASYAELLRIASGPLTDQIPIHLLDLPLSIASNRAWLGLGVIVSIIFWLLHARLHLSPLGWLWLMLPIALLPVSNLIPIRTGPGFVAERFLTFPLALASLAIIQFIESMVGAFDKKTGLNRKTGLFSAGVVTLWLIACGIAVSRQIPRWQDDLALWRWTTSVVPHSGYAQLNLVYALRNNVRFEEAIAISHRAIDLVEEKYQPYLQRNLGFLYLAIGQPDKAIEEFETVLRMQPSDKAGLGTPYDIYLNLGNALMEKRRDTEALHYFELARDLKPEEPSIHYNLGLYHLDHRETVLAIEHFSKALQLYRAMRPSRHNRLQITRGIMNTEQMLEKARAPLSGN